MQIRYSDQDPFEGQSLSIFLAGPTPRNNQTVSWRKEALKILSDLDYTGTVLIPETSDGLFRIDYIQQVEWEYETLCRSTHIVFWIPRELNNMPAFTTNVEFGYWMGVTAESGVSKCFYGRPVDAPKNDYLDWMYQKTTNRNPYCNLKDLLFDVVALQQSKL